MIKSFLLIIVILFCSNAYGFDSGDKVYHDNPVYDGDVFVIRGLDRDNGFVNLGFLGSKERAEELVAKKKLRLNSSDGYFKYDNLASLTSVDSFRIEKLEKRIEALEKIIMAYK